MDVYNIKNSLRVTIGNSFENKKLILSPHSATFTDEFTSRMGIETTKNIIDFFENKIDKSMIVKL